MNTASRNELPDWAHPHPIFLDFETQSACDIREKGGRLYAADPSTRVLCLVFTYGPTNNLYGVWLPDWINVSLPGLVHGKSSPQLWPATLKPKQDVTFFRGTRIPGVLTESIKAGAPLVAHNAYGFDRFIWENCIDKRTIGNATNASGMAPARVLHWLDSILLARASGRPGSLDQLSKQLIGQGKDYAKKLLPKLTTAVPSKVWGGDHSYDYPSIACGDLLAFIRYAVADVELVRRIWEGEFQHLHVEADVIACNDRINNRGIEIDTELVESLLALSEYSVAEARREIDTITGGALVNIRSTDQVHRWLQFYGIKIVDDEGKPCLRKEIVQRYIDSPYLIGEHLESAREIPPDVIQVLELRMRALRITDAKLKRARERVHPDGRARDLHSYHTAGTGRFSSSGIQVHNLPRPIKEIDIERLFGQVEWGNRDARQLFDSVKAQIPERTSTGRKLTVDDVCSALIRPMFRAKKGHLFAIADYSQIEARLAAWAANEQKITKAFKDGRDLYREFAAKFFGVPLEQVTELQRQVAKSAILGAQYSIGPDKLRVYAANMGADLTKAGVTAEALVEGYRNEYTRICGWRPDPQARYRIGGVWQLLDQAIKKCVSEGITGVAGKCRWSMYNRNMICELPSGRIVYYPDARIEDIVPPYAKTLGLPLVPKATVVYTSNRGPKSVYGGLAFENIIQGMARDVLCEGLLGCENADYDVVLDVHDEIVTEPPERLAESTLRGMVGIMSKPPAWAPDLPLECEGFLSPRFVKKPFKGYMKLTTRELEHG